MSDDTKDSGDLTRIEDLSDFIHNEDEEDVSLEEDSSDNLMDLEKESFGEATSFMEIPDELNSETEEIDETSFNDEDSTDFNETSSFEDEDSFGSSADFESSSFDDSTPFDEESEFTTDESLDSSDEFISDDLEFGQGEDTVSSDNFSGTEEFEPESEVPSDDELFSDSPEDFSQDEIKFGEDDDQDETNINEEIPNTQEDHVEAQNNNAVESKTVTAETIIEPPKDYKEPESLNDVAAFAENITAGDLSIEGNPPFSIILKDLKFIEDADEVISILKEYKVIKPENITETQKSLERGQLLIPRLSEYSAIILCHKLRKLDIDISMGLSQEMHSPSSYESIDTGLVSKTSVYTNKKFYKNFNEDSITVDDIQVTNTNSFENFSIIENITIKSKSISIENHLLAPEVFDKNFSSYQDEICKELKQDAIDLDANALINFNISIINSPTDKNITNLMGTASIVRIRAK